MSNPNQVDVKITCWYCGTRFNTSDLKSEEIDAHYADNPTHGTTLKVERIALLGFTGKPASFHSVPNDTGVQQIQPEENQ